MGSTKTETAKMPEFQQEFLENTIFPFAEDFLATPYESYTGERVAGMTPLQTQAMRGYGALDTGAAQYGKAADIYSGLGQLEAPSVSGARIRGVESVGARQLADVDYAKYMSPYTQEVIERGEQDIARQRESALNRLGAQAAAAKAFGGSRMGLAEGETYGQYGRLAADMAAQQRQRAFEQAQGAARFDIGTYQSAEEAAAAREQASRLATAQIGMQASIANQQAALQAAGIRAGAAAGLGNLAGRQLQSQLAGLGAQTAAGEAQRALAQAQLDVPYQDYLAQMQYPLTQFGVLTGAAGAVPQGYGTTTTREGGLGYALSALGSFGQGAGAMGVTFPFSDISLKKNIKKVGQINDINLYRWDWNEEAKSIGADQYPSTGVIAQEVEAKYPEHVIVDETGYRRVNYTGLYSDLGAV